MSDVPVTSAEFLDKAKAIQEERAVIYDSDGGERSMGRAVEAFNAIYGHSISETEGWQFMAILKMVRSAMKDAGFHQDSFEDQISYSALAAEAGSKAAQKTQEPEFEPNHVVQISPDFAHVENRLLRAILNADAVQPHKFLFALSATAKAHRIDQQQDQGLSSDVLQARDDAFRGAEYFYDQKEFSKAFLMLKAFWSI